MPQSDKLKKLQSTLNKLTGSAAPPAQRPQPTNKDIPGTANEPVYPVKVTQDIQGNILPGFNTSHQHFLFLSFGNIAKTKAFIRFLTPMLSSMHELLEFRKLNSARRARMGTTNTLMSTVWVNVAFSHAAIAKLTTKSIADEFGDESYKQGLAARSSLLGDPTSAASPGNLTKWSVGGPQNEADCVVIVAADMQQQLQDAVDAIKKQASANALDLLFEQTAALLPGSFRTHEHFGFKDGVSQPGVRGKLSSNPGDYITPRYIASTDKRSTYYGKPGQLLTWPGQFLLGEPRQSTEDLQKPFRAANNFPKWAKRGSYLIVRRLRQDVPAFWEFAQSSAVNLSLSEITVAAKLVGRWPDGSPLQRSPSTSNKSLGADPFANNHFLFDDNTRPIKMARPGQYPGDNFTQAQADHLATVCPHFSHIRKVNPRESVTDLGKPEDLLARLILRRGIPYGPPLLGNRSISESDLKKDRGLMFLCYNSSIEDQFEFIQRRWANSEVQPNTGGHDPIIGQKGGGTSRRRKIEFPKGASSTEVSIDKDFVIPTGGGYFFAPPISAVRDVLS